MKTIRTASLLLGLALAVGLAGCATPAVVKSGEMAVKTETLEPYECGTVKRLHTFGGIFLASQPQAADFEQAQTGGIVTVVNMRHAKEMEGLDFDEAAVLADLDIEYIMLPWNGADELTDEVLDRGRELLNTAKRPLLVHCSSANRIGPIWIAWRVLDGGIGYEDALAEAKMIGIRTPAYAPKAKDYIARHR